MQKRNKIILFSFGTTILIALSFFFFTSWKVTSVGNLEQYNKWLNDADNKCIVSRNIAGVNVSVKYQPPLYIVLKDISHEKVSVERKSRMIDSLLSDQNNVITFLMIIGPDKQAPKEQQGSSIMSEGVQGYEEYIKRVLSTNFFMDDYISLYVDGTKYKPAICLLENLYELSDKRTFMVVFVSENKSININHGKDFLFEYNDPFFKMGKVQFEFSGLSLSKARDMKLSD